MIKNKVTGETCSYDRKQSVMIEIGELELLKEASSDASGDKEMYIRQEVCFLSFSMTNGSGNALHVARG